eukprot:562231-Rhodomonas_salina.1
MEMRCALPRLGHSGLRQGLGCTRESNSTERLTTQPAGTRCVSGVAIRHHQLSHHGRGDQNADKLSGITACDAHCRSTFARAIGPGQQLLTPQLSVCLSVCRALFSIIPADGRCRRCSGESRA